MILQDYLDFLGDGSCGYYENCKKSSWALNNSNIKLLEYYKNILEHISQIMNGSYLILLNRLVYINLLLKRKINTY